MVGTQHLVGWMCIIWEGDFRVLNPCMHSKIQFKQENGDLDEATKLIWRLYYILYNIVYYKFLIDIYYIIYIIIIIVYNI